MVKLEVSDFAPYHLYRGHFGYSIVPLLPQPLRIITVLRDPIDRTLSNFAQNQRSSATVAELKDFQTLSLLDTLHHEFWGPALTNVLIDNIGQLDLATPDNWHEFRRDWYNTLTSTQRIARIPDKSVQLDTLQSAKERLQNIFCFGLVERYSEFLKLLSYRMEWSPIVETHANVSSNSVNRSELDSITIEKLLEINELDLEFYAYSKQLFDERLLDVAVDQLTDSNLSDRAIHRLWNGRRISALRLDFDTQIPGRGWHPFETANNGYRWTGPETHSSLYLPLITRHALQIRFRILGAITPRALTELRLTANNTIIPLSHTTSPESGGWLFEGIIPVEALKHSKPLTHLVFEVPDTFTPIDMGWNNVDTRKLGVAFDWLEIEPAKS